MAAQAVNNKDFSGYIEWIDPTGNEQVYNIPTSITVSAGTWNSEEFGRLSGFFGIAKAEVENPYIPISVTYNAPATICIFPDGEKIVSKCMEGDTFVKENGVMACIMRKMFETRGEFLRLVEEGYDIPFEKAKREEEKRIIKEANLKKAAEALARKKEKEDTQRITTVGCKDMTKINRV